MSMKWVYIFLFALPGFTSFAQSPLPKTIMFNHFSIDHGLSQTRFGSILQDKNGYMWFGSNNGLIKYDGYSFTTFQFDPLNKNSIPTNYANPLCEDAEGNIWIAGDFGLSKYNVHTAKFTAFRHDSKNKFSLSSDDVSCIVTDKQGRLYIGTDAGVCLYESASDRFINLSEIISTGTLCSRSISCMIIDHNGLLWIGTAKGINIYDPANKDLKLFNPADKNYAAGNREIVYMMEDHTGDIWISLLKNGIYRYHPSGGISTVYRHLNTDLNSLGSDLVNSLIEDSHYTIWAGMWGGGISRYFPETGNFRTFRSDVNDINTLGTDQIVNLFEDRSGAVWISTSGAGLNNYYGSNKNFKIFKNYDKEFTSHFPLSLYKDHEGKIFITTFGGGVKELDPASGIFTSYKIVLPNDKISGGNFCYGALEASDGNFWVVSFDEGLHKLDRKTGKFTTVHSTYDNPDTSLHNLSNCIAEDKNKRLWIGTNSGLKSYNLITKTFSGFEKLYRDTNQLSTDVISSLYMDKEGVLWIAGSQGGLTLFNTGNGEIKIFKHDETNLHSIGPGNINCFYDNQKGKVWIGTDGGGLNEFDKKSGQFISFTMKDGLPDNSILGILADDEGKLWLSTNKGICKFTPASGQSKKVSCRNYDKGDGLPSDEFYYNTSVKGDDGTFYFGSNAGLVAFKPDELKDNPFIPPVVITDFSVFNKSITSNDSSGILKLPADETKEITLSYKQNVFSFAFSALNYVHPEKNKFAYKLDNFDKDWIYTDATRRFANYTNLDAGEYTFRVKASNNDGIWNEKGVSIKLIITPPYWQTGWFKFLYLLTGILILYAVYNNRMQKLKDMRRIRNKIASDLHDDLGATLSSISIMSELANQQVKDRVPLAVPLLEKIGSSSRNMIESVNDMVWAINPKNDSFENIIKRMRMFALEILSAKEIAFHFDFDRNLLQSKLKMEMRRSFYLIFKESVNNIAKYSNASNVSVVIVKRENNLKMTIKDDGNGFVVNTISKGNGLINMQQRAEDMKARFNLESIPGKGTFIEIEFKN